MKASPSPLLAALSALALLGTVALTGCTATDLAGPDTAPPAPQPVETTQAHRPSPTDAAHNNTENEGGGTTTGAKHNTMPEDD